MPSHGTMAVSPFGLLAATRHWLPEGHSLAEGRHMRGVRPGFSYLRSSLLQADQLCQKTKAEKRPTRPHRRSIHLSRGTWCQGDQATGLVLVRRHAQWRSHAWSKRLAPASPMLHNATCARPVPRCTTSHGNWQIFSFGTFVTTHDESELGKR